MAFSLPGRKGSLQPAVSNKLGPSALQPQKNSAKNLSKLGMNSSPVELETPLGWYLDDTVLGDSQQKTKLNCAQTPDHKTVK